MLGLCQEPLRETSVMLEFPRQKEVVSYLYHTTPSVLTTELEDISEFSV